MKPCPQTLWGRGRPQDMSMPGQYTAWKRRMSLPMMWLPGHPCCFRLSAVGSTPSGNRPGQYNYCSCTGADSCEQVSKQGLLTWALPCGVAASGCLPLTGLPGHPCCFNFSAGGSIASGNKPEQCNYCSCRTDADSCVQVGRQDLLMWLPSQPCCRRLSAVGSLPSGNRLVQQFWFQHT